MAENTLRPESYSMPSCNIVLLLIGSRFDLLDWAIVYNTFIF